MSNVPQANNVVGIARQQNKIRFVTAASLFDGHDASINIMRRILQSQGAEVIHLGHNRSVAEIVNAALQEDAQGIAISSYQGRTRRVPEIHGGYAQSTGWQRYSHLCRWWWRDCS